MGRTIRESRPGYSASIVRENFYNFQGRLWKITNTGTTHTLIEYDNLGNVTRRGMSASGGSSLQQASMDRISESDLFYEEDQGDWERGQSIILDWTKAG